MIGAIENAMLAKIVAACTAGALPYAYRTATTWPHNFDKFLSSQVQQYPAIWAVFGGVHRMELVSRGRWKAHAAFGVVVAAENKRNEESRRQGGSPSEPGSYQLAEDAARVLAGQDLGLDINALEPTSILPVETPDVPSMKQISMYAVSFDTVFEIDTVTTGGNVNDFLIWHADWDPAPYGHVDRTHLPDDGDATGGADNLTLEPA